MKRVLIILSPLVLTLLLIGFALRQVGPDLEKWLRGKVLELSTAHTPFRVNIGEVQMSWLPPALIVKDIHGEAQDSKKLGITDIDLDQVTAKIDLLQLFVGRLAVSDLILDAIDLEINLDPLLVGSKTATPQSLDLSPIFENLKILPIHRVFINNLNCEVGSERNEFRALVFDGSLLVVNERAALSFEAELPSTETHWKDSAETLYLRLGGVLRPDQLQLRKVHAQIEGLDAQAEAEIQNLKTVMTNPSIHLSADFQMDLDALEKKWQSKFQLPEAQGRLKGQAEFKINEHWPQDGRLRLEAQDLAFKGYKIGDFNISGRWQNDHFTTDAASFTSDAAEVELKNTVLHWNKSFEKPEVDVTSKVILTSVSLDDLLINIKVGDIPLELFINGDGDCSGQLVPGFHLHCNAHLKAPVFEVGSGDGIDKNIIQAHDLEAIGEGEVDLESAKIRGQLKVGKSSGGAEGAVSYNDGFNFKYWADNLDFSDLHRLAGLRLTGETRLTGQTVGTAHTGQFTIEGQSKNLWFEDFFLGDPKLTLNYENGTLHFTKIKGQLSGNSYTGDVHVNLLKPEIRFNLDALDFETLDATKIFSRKLQMPIEITGPLNVHTQGRGPLALGQLTYDFNLTGKRIIAAGEVIDDVNFSYHADSGKGFTKECRFVKGRTQMPCKGVSNPKGIIDFTLNATPFFVEDSDFIGLLGSNISGQGSAHVHATGPVYDPLVQIDWKTENIFIEENILAPSQGRFYLDKRFFKGDISLLAGKLKSQFKWPFSETDPLYIEASARDWNFAPLFTLIGSGPLLSEYQSSLTGDISIHGASGGLFKSSGQGTFTRAFLKRENVELSNPGPMDFIIDNGNLTLKNFRMSGGDSYLELDSNRTREDRLNLKISSKMQLRIAQIFFPFLDDLKGLATVRVNVGGSLDQPEILGVGSLQDGTVKVKKFPHAFEKINANAQFSQRRVLVTDITGVLAGGSFEGDGAISIQGPRNLPSQFHFYLDGVTFNVPDKIKTSGDGEVDITGSWFPFLLSGTYRVQSGLVTKEFAPEEGDSEQKQSAYLPKTLLQSTAEPLNMNLKVVISPPLLIKNSLLEGSASGELLVTGTPSRPILNGKMTLEKDAKITFKDKIFDVSVGTATFKDPKEINPEIYVSANAHVAEYDINLLTLGKGKAPVIKLSSTPALADSDIISLLALGVTTGSSSQGTAFIQKDTQQNMNTQLGAAVFDQVTKPVQKALAVDIQVSSQYDDTKNLATQSYTLSKKISDKLVFSATETQGDQADQTYKLKYNFDSKKSVSTSFETVQTPTTNSVLAPQTQGQVLGVDFEFKEEFH
jgi:translocation and assembly module TamB